MTLKRRLDSTWKNIAVLGDDGGETDNYDLDRYGRLVTKFEKNRPRNIKELLANTNKKRPPSKPFILPLISAQPLATPILSSPINIQKQIPLLPEIQTKPPETDFKEALWNDPFIESNENAFNDDFLLDIDLFNGFDYYDMPLDNSNF